jgi:hypothetical protein
LPENRGVSSAARRHERCGDRAVMVLAAPWMSTDPSVLKLVRMFGEDRADAIVHEAFEECGVTDLTAPDDRLRFGASLVKKGGLLAMIGRAIRVQAILAGARPDADQVAP